ncbi:pirin family protein [Pseudomonas batumici]|uniref:Pirin-related protein n=1 Tax=Pseudomonas batumici TaxID=226910 RepID=A0A0C2I9T3_9PSED|nr:pirin family protein [Pseudomonas batumici]KIH83705.1 Pirin-related protein [Pseudomonas batumici]
MSTATARATQPRAIVYRTHGSTHGAITRLVSPGDLGGWLKPFVFLDHFSFRTRAGQPGFGMHPHSGIATLSYLSEGEFFYEDSTGEQGRLLAGGVEWMQAGNGVWHTGSIVPEVSHVRGFQLWVALPAAQENAPARSQYLTPSQVQQEGPARVLLGQYGAAQSLIEAPAPMNYLAVQLKDGERWTYVPPAGHTVGWVAVDVGRLDAGDRKGLLGEGELAIFEENEDAIELVARGDTTFVLGSARKHPHDLVLGNYSVHTSAAALVQGEAEIQRIGRRLREEGRL